MSERLQEFLRYLTDRGAVGSILKTSGFPFFLHRQFAKYDHLLNAGQYLIFPQTNTNYPALLHYLKKMGLIFFEGRLGHEQKPTQFLISGTDINYSPLPVPKRIVALVHVYNEADILGETIRHLLGQGLHVHIIDNWSTDGSWEIAGAFPETQVKRERFPQTGPSEHYEWFRQLEHTEQLANRLPYDWFLHYDADELRYSPWPGISLQDAIGFVDRLGYNAIDFTVLD